MNRPALPPLPRWLALSGLAAALLLPGAAAPVPVSGAMRDGLQADEWLRRPVLAAAGAEADEPTTDRLIVRYRSGSTGNRRSVLSASSATHASLYRLGVSVLRTHRGGLGAQVMSLSRSYPVSELQAVAEQLMADDATVLYAEPDQRVQAFAAAPDDTMFGQQWHYTSAVGGINLLSAWDLSTGSGVTVSVIDTGTTHHADLSGQEIGGHDFISSASIANDGDGRDADPTDTGDGCSSGHSSWHGTHVAGTIAAVTNNATGVAGVAPAAKLIHARALGCGGGYSSDIADAIAWSAGATVSGVPANAHPARVLNMSLGGQGSCGTTTQNAINAARALGAVVIVAAGNSNADVTKFNPANCKGVVTIAATGPTGARAPYSNKGSAVDLAAPGGDMSRGSSAGILSTLNDGTTSPGNDIYQFYQGTSMATPHVAGVAALMLARNDKLTPDEVESILKSTVRAFPAGCTGCGKGIVDAAKAVSAVFVGAAQATDLSEVEPNNTSGTAQALASLPARVIGTIATGTDVDQFSISLAAGATVVARLIPNPTSNYDLQLRNAAGTTKGASAKGTGIADTITWRNGGSSTVTMYLRVARVSGTTGSEGSYTLEVAQQ